MDRERDSEGGKGQEQTTETVWQFLALLRRFLFPSFSAPCVASSFDNCPQFVARICFCFAVFLSVCGFALIRSRLHSRHQAKDGDAGAKI